MRRFAGFALVILLLIAACTPSDPRTDDSDVFGSSPTPQGVVQNFSDAAAR